MQKELNNLIQIWYSKLTFIALLIVIAIAVFSRISNLTFNSIYSDELHSIFIIKEGLYSSFNVDVHPPLFFILLWFWAKVFGNSDFALRMFSVAAGIGSIVIFYLLVELLIDKTCAWIAALFMAVSPFHVFYSQEIRGYTLLLFVSVLTLYFFSKFAKQGKTVNIIGYILSATSIFYTHNLGFISFVTVNILFLIESKFHRREGKLKKWILAQLITLILAGPAIIKTLEQKIWSVQTDRLPMINPNYILEWVFDIIGYRSVTLAVLFTSFSLCGLILGLFLKNNGKRLAKYMGIWLLTQFVMVALISCYVTPMAFGGRHVIQSSLSFFAGLALVVWFFKRMYIRIIILILILFIEILGTWHYHSIPSKTEWREASNFIQSEMGNYDTAMIANWDFMAESFKRYYSDRNPLIKIPIKGDWHSVPDSQNLEEIVEWFNKPPALGEYQNIYFITREDHEITILSKTIRNQLGKLCSNEEVVLKADNCCTVGRYLGYYHPLFVYRFTHCSSVNL